MLILSIRTDNPKSEIGLFQDHTQTDYIAWPAHRQLAETIHTQISDLLLKNHYNISDLSGIVVYKGPGSFTGLRIGISTANALAENVPSKIVGTTGENWIAIGIEKLKSNENHGVVMPEYGSPVNITKPKH